jgi:hypothetical protein
VENELTIREKEQRKIENINKSKQEMNSWGIYRYPTPTKKVKSISLLRKKLNQFFMENSADETADRLPTPTRLAIYLGYASSTAMYKDINDRTEPEYSDLLARAVDMIKDALQKRQLEIAESKEDWHGIEAVLQRMDKAQGLDTKKSQNDVNINISIEEKQRIKSTIDDRLGFLNAEFTEIKPKSLSESVMKLSQSEGEEP